jgi:hypothetical protein
MGKIPTRLWAASIGLCDTPLCRHCDSVLEDENHWFFQCPSLNYSSLIIYDFTNFKDISVALCSERTFEIENAVLRFIKFNDLFQVQNSTNDDDRIPDPPSKPKRKLDVSPSPSRHRKHKKSRSIRIRKRAANSELVREDSGSSTKRRFMGPAQFTRYIKEQISREL